MRCLVCPGRFMNDLYRVRAQQTPPPPRGSRRLVVPWWSLLEVAGQQAVAGTALDRAGHPSDPSPAR